MPKKKDKASKIDEETLRSVALIAAAISVADEECREIVQQCSNAAVQRTEDAHRDRVDRNRAALEIIEGFIHYGRWCHLKRDDGLMSEQQDEVIISAPPRIVPDAWSSNAVPIRKICRRKEDLFPVDTKPDSKTNSVRSGQSGHSRMTKGSLRSKLKRASMELDGKKTLQNIPDEDAADEAKPKIIQLTQPKADGKVPSKRQRKNRGGESNKKADTKEVGDLAINLGNGNKSFSGKTGGPKTGRLSMRSSNAYKYHPNAPYTFDHTGRKMAVVHLKPGKLPSNRVTPTVTFPNANAAAGPSSPKQGRKMNVTRKSRKKIASKPKAMAPAVAHRKNTVSVQPAIETICKPAEGVTLKSGSGVTIKGPEPNKKSIANLSRAEYNQYVAAMRHNQPKTQVFETRRKRSSESAAHRNSDNVAQQSPSTKQPSLPAVESAAVTAVIASRPSGSPKSLRYRMEHRNESPKSLKYKRAMMSQHSDRMISEYNQHSMLPPLQPKDQNQYQRKFVEKVTAQKVHKSKLGMTIFEDVQK